MLSACNKYIYDDLDHCQRGIYVNLYEQTVCADAPTYPSVPIVHAYVFDEEGKLVTVHQEIAPVLSPQYECFVPIEKAGTYSVVVWTGILSDCYNVSTLFPQVTTKEDLLLMLRSEEAQAVSLNGQRLYVGATPLVRLGSEENLFAHTEANLREITNRIRVTLQGIPTPEEYTIEVYANNGAYAISGDIISKANLFYPAHETSFTENSISSEFTTLKLYLDRSSFFSIRHQASGEEIFTEELAGTILSNVALDKNLDLRCTNDFHILLKAKKREDPAGYMVAELWVNNWLVHSYDVVF